MKLAAEDFICRFFLHALSTDFNGAGCFHDSALAEATIDDRGGELAGSS